MRNSNNSKCRVYKGKEATSHGGKLNVTAIKAVVVGLLKMWATEKSNRHIIFILAFSKRN